MLLDPLANPPDALESEENKIGLGNTFKEYSFLTFLFSGPACRPFA
jgi:hypothetical protein